MEILFISRVTIWSVFQNPVTFVTIKWQACSALLYLFTPCMECCGHAEIVYAFQSIEKKVKKGSIKESPWRSG